MRRDTLSPGLREVWAAVYAVAVRDGVPAATAAEIATRAVQDLEQLCPRTGAIDEHGRILRQICLADR